MSSARKPARKPPRVEYTIGDDDYESELEVPIEKTAKPSSQGVIEGTAKPSFL
jgi:hypothetical protein